MMPWRAHPGKLILCFYKSRTTNKQQSFRNNILCKFDLYEIKRNVYWHKIIVITQSFKLRCQNKFFKNVIAFTNDIFCLCCNQQKIIVINLFNIDDEYLYIEDLISIWYFALPILIIIKKNISPNLSLILLLLFFLNIYLMFTKSRASHHQYLLYDVSNVNFFLKIWIIYDFIIICIFFICYSCYLELFIVDIISILMCKFGKGIHNFSRAFKWEDDR